jgi:hypothetical protein
VIKLVDPMYIEKMNNNELKQLKSLLPLLIKINEYIVLNFDKLVTVNYIQEYSIVIQEKQNEKYIEININNIIQYLFNVLKESNFNFL